MNNNLANLIDESITLELNVSNLYLLFYELFPDDEDFWWALMLEEKAHASLLKSGKMISSDLTVFPKELLYHDLTGLKETNRKLLSLIEKFKKSSPSRSDAFKTALRLENSAAELHFQKFMDEETNSELSQLFKELNQSDKDHSLRIEAYMNKNDI